MGKCKQCKGRLEEDFISDYLTMSVDQRPCTLCRGTGVIRTGPYRLADGTWSDGVDRKLRICDQSGYDCDKNRIFVLRYHDIYSKMRHVWVVDRQEPWIDEEFDSWEEAIEYATKKGLQ